MKKTMTFLTMITLVSSLVLTTSCKKDKSEDPVPAAPTNTTGGGGNTTGGGGNTTGGGGTVVTNQAPTISNATYNGSNMITVDASDIDGTVSKVEFINGGIVVGTDDTAPFEFNTSSLSPGTYNNFQSKATDDKGAFTTYNINSFDVTGNTPKDITTAIMNKYVGRPLDSNPSGLYFKSNGTVSTGVNNVNFWGGSCTSGTWVVNSDGTMTISNSCNNGTNHYTVEIVSSSGALKLTNINNTSYVWGGR
jgi:hypothetical protein